MQILNVDRDRFVPRRFTSYVFFEESSMNDETVGNKVYVGNLPYNISEGDIEALFAPFGHVVEVRIVYDRVTRRSKGFGFVEFSDPSSAESSLVLSGQDFQGRPLKVSIARERERTERSSRGDGGGNGGGRSRW